MLKRRDFIKALGGLAATASATRSGLAADSTPVVGVVGGGIVGATIALHLTRSGSRVILFERDKPAAGATGKSFAWINAYTTNPHYRALRMKSINAWRELDRDDNLGIVWGGALHWAMSAAEAEVLKAEATEFAHAGYTAEVINRERLNTLAPGVALGSFRAAMFNAMDGHMDPVDVTERIVAHCRSEGVSVEYPCNVRGIKLIDDQLSALDTSKGEFTVNRLVIAGGVDSPFLAAEVGYKMPLIHSPGILLHTQRVKPVLGRVVESPNTYFKQYADGRIVGNDGYYAPNILEHAAILRGPQEMPEEIRRQHGERILDVIKQKLPAADDAQYDHLTLGYRPMPEDRMPIVGFVPGRNDVYLAVMHSGVTLAAIMGRYVAAEVAHGKSIPDLAPYRPERFPRT